MTPTPDLSASESTPAEPALPSGSINLPAIAPNHLPATDESLTEQLIRLLATSYVRKENRFYHVDRPSEALSQSDLQRSFMTPAQVLNGGHEVPRAVMKQVFDTAIVQLNPNPYRSIPVWTGSIAAYPSNPERRILLESGQVVLNSWTQPAYRRFTSVSPKSAPFSLLFHQMFPRKAERTRASPVFNDCFSA